MKKSLTLQSKLKLNIKKVLVLTPSEMGKVAAGEDSVFTRPRSYDCVAPFNAPPYYDGPIATDPKG